MEYVMRLNVGLLSVVRVTTVLAAAIVASTYWSEPVLADKPVREPAPFPDTIGQFCDDFEVLIHAIFNRETLTFFIDGRVHLAGSFKAEVTNLETNKTIEVNASGPLTITADGTTLVGVGRGLLFGEAGFFGPGAPAELSLNSGQIVFSAVDFSILSRVGHTEDLCEELAGP
jgi:hypothetical protein